MVAYTDTFGAALRRQKWVILATIALTMAGSLGTALLLPQTYRAEARIAVGGIAPAAALAALQSPALAARTIASLRLQNDPEFSGHLALSGKFLSLSIGPDEVPADVSAAFRQRLRVGPTGDATVLAVDFTSADPEKAALIATTLATLFVGDHKPAVSDDGSTPSASDLQAAIEADTAAIAALQPSPAMQQVLSRQRETLLKHQADLSRRYGPKHPRMIETQAQLDKLSQQMQPASPEKLIALQNRQAAERKMLDALIAITTARQTEAAQVRLTAAAVPPAPGQLLPAWSYPAAAMAGLALGLLLAGINEKLDRRVRSVRQLETLTGLTCAAVIPLREQKTPAAASYVLQKPASPLAEAVRTLRATLRLIGDREGRSLKVITVTSPHRAEPRALIAVWLARLAARAGEKVLLIDADLRAPDVHTLLEQSNSPSLVDYLTGQTHLEQIVTKKDPSGMHVIFASSVPNTAPDLIGSAKMTKLMSYLRQGYDLVVVCAPPCLAGADASLLANESDHTLYLIDTQATSRTDVERGIKLFAGFGYSSVSPVLTDAKG